MPDTDPRAPSGADRLKPHPAAPAAEPAAGAAHGLPGHGGHIGADTSLLPDGGAARSTAASAAPAGPTEAAAGPAFDACHAGVVLRAVLVVHAGIAVGVAFDSAGLEAWLVDAVLAASVAFPALLFWLVAVCALKDLFDRWPAPASSGAAIALGALIAAACWGLQANLGVGRLADARAFAAGRWPAPALAGAAFAALLVAWLRLRATAQQPADASARLAELQSRIRPHFLFNTLNTAIALARVDPARTEGLLEDLAELFRGALAEGHAVVTLADEIELARRYLAIEQTRFGERLDVSWELDPAAGNARMPPLLLQPLVENAVRHGVECDPAGGRLRIRTRARGGQVVLTIVNTLPHDDSSAMRRPGTGMALANVRERLHLMHDVASEFDAGPEADVWRVRIVVPLG